MLATPTPDYYKIVIDFVKKENVLLTGYIQSPSFPPKVRPEYTVLDTTREHYNSCNCLWVPQIIIQRVVNILLHIIYLFKPFEAYSNPHKQAVEGLTQSKRLFAQSWWRDSGLLVSTGNTTPGAVSLSYKPEFFIVTLASLLYVLKDMLRKIHSVCKSSIVPHYSLLCLIANPGLKRFSTKSTLLSTQNKNKHNRSRYSTCLSNLMYVNTF